MKLRTRLLGIGLGVLLAAGGGAGLLVERPAVRNIALDDACKTPAKVIEPKSARQNTGDAVVFHGLSANSEIMQPMGQALADAGWRVYLLDSPGHGRSVEPFSYAAVDRCAAAAVELLEKNGSILPARTMLVGHSLGAAAAVRLADRDPMAATVAISPAPLVLPQREPPNLLVLAGQFDIRAVKAAARELLHAAGGRRESAEDFVQKRAVDLRMVSGEEHGTMVLDPRVWRMAIAWGGEAMGKAVSQAEQAGAVAGPRLAMLCNLLLLAGLAFLVAPMETAIGRAIGVGGLRTGRRAGVERADSRKKLGWRGILGRWAVAAFFAAALLGLLDAARHLRPVRLEDGDWAALAAVVTGVVLMALYWKAIRGAFRFDGRMAIYAAVTGAATLWIFVAALNLDLGELTFNEARLWRMAVLVAFTLPYFLVEEAVLGPPGGRGRFSLFLAMRGTVWLAQLFALFVFWQSGLILVLMAGEFGVVSVGQRLAADALRNRGAGPGGAALFDAILAAGMLALILPLI